MGWKIKVERVESARAQRRELKRLEEEAARLKLRIAAARFDLKHTLGSHPYAAAALALSAGVAVGYSPALRQALMKTSFQIVEGLLQAGAGAASGFASTVAPVE
ncbi:MAG TPA: hypothetical protein VM658_05355 [bacterium]|nr:hypothetical protein [bacterium]